MFDPNARSLAELRSLIDSALAGLLAAGLRRESQLDRAVCHTMFSGGKRTRPLLTLLAAQACGSDVKKALPAACAIECLHCASLILDDMPCMDNASERRGVSAAHVMFGEGVAVLAALALLNQAYTLFGQYPGLAAEGGLCVAQMIEGQAIDLQGGRERAHRKTSGLLRLSLTAGAIACTASDAQVRALGRCGEYLGEAYQIYDDFEDGDSPSDTGADNLVSAARSVLQNQFGPTAFPLLTAIDAIVSHFNHRSLVAA